MATMSTGFLDRLATQLKANQNAACRRAIQWILAVIKKNYEDGEYDSSIRETMHKTVALPSVRFSST